MPNGLPEVSGGKVTVLLCGLHRVGADSEWLLAVPLSTVGLSLRLLCGIAFL